MFVSFFVIFLFLLGGRWVWEVRVLVAVGKCNFNGHENNKRLMEYYGQRCDARKVAGN